MILAFLVFGFWFTGWKFKSQRVLVGRTRLEVFQLPAPALHERFAQLLADHPNAFTADSENFGNGNVRHRPVHLVGFDLAAAPLREPATVRGIVMMLEHGRPGGEIAHANPAGDFGIGEAGWEIAQFLFPVNFQWKQQSQELRILSTVIFTAASTATFQWRPIQSGFAWRRNLQAIAALLRAPFL